MLKKLAILGALSALMIFPLVGCSGPSQPVTDSGAENRRIGGESDTGGTATDVDGTPVDKPKGAETLK